MQPHVTWLRAFAALLIVNSHLEAQYPIHQAAVDGLLGNSLFFFLAGLGLVASERQSRRGFFDWYGRRLSRILPSVVLLILVVVYLPQRAWLRWSLLETLRHFLAPPGYEFVEQILLLYIPFFVVQRLGGQRGNAWVLASSLVLMLAFPAFGKRASLFHPFHWLYYFQMMLLGAWVGWRDQPARPLNRPFLVLFALTGVTYSVAKFATSRPAFSEWYPLLNLLVFPLVLMLVRIFQSQRLARLVERQRWLAATLGLVGGLTLEIYLVHYVVLRSPIVARLPFPANVAFIFVGSLALAIPLAHAAEWLRRALRWGSQRDQVFSSSSPLPS